MAGTNEIKYWVLSYGHHAEIKEPQSLRDEVKQDLTRTLKRY
ncbi:MAG: WYL domain-containing protein [Thermodesulfobacteriota bacterium]|nr:WYL domain-containing protein [Thermodesulfobacteriota bacterium]